MKSITCLAVSALLAGCQSDKVSNALPLVIGTYTDSGAVGLYSAAFDTLHHELHLLDSLTVSNPSYLTFRPDGKQFYAVSENKGKDAQVYAVDYDAASGKMTVLNHRSTHGDDPCHVATNGSLLTVANYGGGNLSVFPIEDNGELGEMLVDFKGSTGGSDTTRQREPHVHCSAFSPDKHWLFFSDFSGDRIVGVGQGANRDTVQVASGSGPRHLVFSPSGKQAYLVSELSDAVTGFDYDGYGKLTAFQTLTGNDAHGRGGADIHLSPDGKFLYSSHRLKNDGIAIFSVSPSGMLERVGYQLTGRHPRQFMLTPDGKYLLCACRDDNVIQIYARNAQTGLLKLVGKPFSLPHPVCIRFAPEAKP